MLYIPTSNDNGTEFDGTFSPVRIKEGVVHPSGFPVTEVYVGAGTLFVFWGYNDHFTGHIVREYFDSRVEVHADYTTTTTASRFYFTYHVASLYMENPGWVTLSNIARHSDGSLVNTSLLFLKGMGGWVRYNKVDDYRIDCATSPTSSHILDDWFSHTGITAVDKSQYNRLDVGAVGIDTRFGTFSASGVFLLQNPDPWSSSYLTAPIEMGGDPNPPISSRVWGETVLGEGSLDGVSVSNVGRNLNDVPSPQAGYYYDDYYVGYSYRNPPWGDFGPVYFSGPPPLSYVLYQTSGQTLSYVSPPTDWLGLSILLRGMRVPPAGTPWKIGYI